MAEDCDAEQLREEIARLAQQVQLVSAESIFFFTYLCGVSNLQVQGQLSEGCFDTDATLG